MAQVVDLKSRRKNPLNIENGKVPPQRRPNSEVRTREYLTQDKLEALMKAAGELGRHGPS